MAKGEKGAAGAPKVKRLSFDEFRARHEAVFAEDEDLLLAKALSSGGNKRVSLASSSTFGPDYGPWFASQGYRLTKELQTYWRVRLLAAAAKENSPEAFRDMLESWLSKLRIEAPKGVFTPSRRALGEPVKRSGRPISSENEQIYSIWNRIGQPSPYSNALANAFYGPKFTIASGTDRRKMRDRCRNAVDRRLDREIAVLESKLANQDKRILKLREQSAELRSRLEGEPKIQTALTSHSWVSRNVRMRYRPTAKPISLITDGSRPAFEYMNASSCSPLFRCRANC
jgi:hypothetical protein